MNILLVMIPLSILLAISAVIAFFWAVDHDQFDDLDTPKLLPLLDEPPDAPIPRGETSAQHGAPRSDDDLCADAERIVRPTDTVEARHT